MASVHPPQEHLSAYASGALGAGMSLLVASHLTYCPSCRRTVADLEAMSGEMFADLGDGGLSMPSIDAALNALDSPEDNVPLPKAAPTSPLPRPILAAAGADVDSLRWRFRMPGLYESPLPGFEGEEVSLLRVKPGAGMIDHTHSGEEATLILSGAMEDDGQVFRRGDVSFADHNDDHSPKVIGDELCYCLIVMSGSVKFTGRVTRALNIFTS